jgi:L,D-transpeptidase YbiS
MPIKINGPAGEVQPAPVPVQESSDALPKEEPMTPQGINGAAPAAQPATSL